jgi:hypothetical protein
VGVKKHTLNLHFITKPMMDSQYHLTNIKVFQHGEFAIIVLLIKWSNGWNNEVKRKIRHRWFFVKLTCMHFFPIL